MTAQPRHLPKTRSAHLRVCTASLLTLLLGACGGGNSTSTSTPPSVVPTPTPIVTPKTDTQAPTVTGLSAVSLSMGKVSVRISTVSGDDATAVCLRSDTVRPAATDACFGSGDIATVTAVTGVVAYRGYARDAAGNVSASFEQTIDAYALDTGAPVVSAVTRTVMGGGKVKLVATVADDQGVTGTCFSTSTSTTAPAATDACFQASNELVVDEPTDQQAYRVHARDAAGKVSVARPFLLDLKPPVVSGVSVVANSAGKISLQIAGTDNVGVTGWCLRAVSSGATTVSPTPPASTDACFTANPQISVTSPSSDVGRYEAHARDDAGNVSAAYVHTIDLGTPSVVSASVSAAAAGVVTVTAQAVDSVGITGYCLRPATDTSTPLDGDACFQASPALAFTLPSPPTTATTTVRLYAKDAAGHVSLPLLRTICTATALPTSVGGTLPIVCLQTTLGDIALELESNKAPRSSTNFLAYVDGGFYTDTLFHRVMYGFMVQGGGNTLTGAKTTNAAITLERTTLTTLSHTRGTLALARSTAADSATSQFFINVVDNSSTLNATSTADGYAVFGRVLEGMDTTVQALRSVAVVNSSSGEFSAPVDQPRIVRAYRMK
ncbi:peptidylprolyl isomerase [Leptothrix sp. BB-4]